MQNNISSPSYVTVSQTLDAENAVIGSLLVEPELIDLCTVSVETFVSERNRMIYGAIQKINDRNEPIDLVTISIELGDSMQEIGVSYLAELAQSIPTTANFSFYVQKMKEFHLERKGRELVTQYQDENLTMVELIAALTELDMQKERGGAKTMGDLLNELFHDMQLEKDAISGVETGFPELDRMIDGLQGGDLVVIGARPGAGKTALVMNVAGNITDNGNGASLFNYEMQSLAIARRLVASSTSIETFKMKNGERMTDHDWSKFSAGAGKLSQRKLMVHRAPGMHARDIRRAVAQDMKKFKAKKHVVIVDYLQLVSSIRPNDRANDNSKVGEICRELKLLALQLDVPVILLSQLSRAVEQRQDKRPIMSDLRDSGNIEQDADVIMMLYRDDYYNPDSEDKGMIEVLVKKQRDGDTGTVKLLFRKEYGKMLSLEDMQG